MIRLLSEGDFASLQNMQDASEVWLTIGEQRIPVELVTETPRCHGPKQPEMREDGALII